MKYETVKSFILVVLVGISFLLSFILWSYQPNYENVLDTSYVNEVDIGGLERTKNEVVEPIEIVFRNGEKATSFITPNDRYSFYKDIASWSLYDYRLTNSNGRPDDNKKFVEMVFSSAIPADLVTNLFTFHDQIDPPSWSFERAFLVLDEKQRTVELKIISVDNRKQITATIEKAEVYDDILAIMKDESKSSEYISFGVSNSPIYLPKDRVKMAKKTLAATIIRPDDFINALFSNPALVTPNVREAYFTDGQRGLRIVQDGRKLEFFNPIEATYNILDPIELVEKSVNNINEHKGWTNDYLFENINKSSNNIRYRLYYEGYPVFDHYSLSIIEQEWREQELFQYTRSLIKIGNLLNSEEVQLPSGQEISTFLQNDNRFKIENIHDIQIGYTMSHLDDAHSLMLEPNWYILYQGEWIKLNLEDYQKDLQVTGGD
ncbi:two-component system activity regulator YycH [Pseudogracilibacillus sp. SE30717A]|uniref:YycH family regulatory protein n=1 Tax=Pseudogracilibacillus sp. SE30717A TaxID=3098293 RepID=UPI00300E63F2